jgi:hypothetical protein
VESQRLGDICAVLTVGSVGSARAKPRLVASAIKLGDGNFEIGCPSHSAATASCLKCGGEDFISVYCPAEFAPVTCLSCGHLTTVKDALHPFPSDGAEPVADRAR